MPEEVKEDLEKFIQVKEEDWRNGLLGGRGHRAVDVDVEKDDDEEETTQEVEENPKHTFFNSVRRRKNFEGKTTWRRRHRRKNWGEAPEPPGGGWQTCGIALWPR